MLPVRAGPAVMTLVRPAFICYQLSEMASISDSKKKKRGRPPTGIGPAIGLRLYPDLALRLEAWIQRQRLSLSRPEAIRRLLEEALASAENVGTKKKKQ